MAEENNIIDFEKQRVEDKLNYLYKLQIIDSKIDEINLIKGELPLEVRDLEDEIAGLETRMQNLENSNEVSKSLINSSEQSKIESDKKIKHYTEQLNQIVNNREFESINREIEYQTLEMELRNKEISKYKAEIEAKKELLATLSEKITIKNEDLALRKLELNKIQLENKQEEEILMQERKDLIQKVEPRLLYAYGRIRGNVINKIAVAHIDREACSGCNSKIPPQRQIEIKSNKKIISCEFCGRILVDKNSFSE